MYINLKNANLLNFIRFKKKIEANEPFNFCYQ